MTTINSPQRTAMIIQFPVGARAIGGGRRDESKSAAHFMPQRVVKVASGGAWYHEEAIREDERPSAR
jgi:hypothetical protein